MTFFLFLCFLLFFLPSNSGNPKKLKKINPSLIFFLVYVLYANEFTNILYIANPTTSWTLSPTASPSYSACNSKIDIVGGYQTFYESQYLTKTYSSLPSHSSIKVVFTLYLLDLWNGQSIEVVFDSTSVSNVAYTTEAGSVDICGNTYKDMIKNITLSQIHSANSFKIKIQSHISLTSDYGYSLSWGIRDMQIFLDVPCPGLCISCSLLPTCDNLVLFAKQDSSTYAITCKDGFFNDQNENRCNVCHYSCKTCKGIGQYNCTGCFTDDTLDSTVSSCNHSSKNNQILTFRKIPSF